MSHYCSFIGQLLEDIEQKERASHGLAIGFYHSD